MAKKTIGHFKYKDRKYNIYMLRGYKKMKCWVYIGNSTFKMFIRFHTHTEEIFLYEPIDKKGYIDQPRIRFYVPKSENDIKELLSSLLKGSNMELLELTHKSREDIMDEILLDAI